MLRRSEVEVEAAEEWEERLVAEQCSGRRQVLNQSRSRKQLPSSTTGFGSPG